MDDKKKIIILVVAVVVAIGLIVLITLTRNNGGGLGSLLPIVTTPTFPVGPGGGTPSGPTQPGGGVGSNATGTSAQAGPPSAFVRRTTIAPSGGYVLLPNGIYVANGTQQPSAYVAKPVNVSDAYLLSQITSSSVDLGPYASQFGLSAKQIAADYLNYINNIPADPNKIASLLKNANGTPIPVPGLVQNLLNTTSSNPSDVLNSLANFQGLTADQVTYLQSIQSQIAGNAITGGANQDLINLGIQNMNLINGVLANASGSISKDLIQSILQKFNVSSTNTCQQIFVDSMALASSSGNPIFNWLSTTNGGQFAPLLSCGTPQG